MQTIDIHSHIADHYFDKNRDGVLARMEESQTGTIAIGVDFDSSNDASKLAQEHEHVWACIGAHPEEGAKFDEAQFAPLLHDRVVAVGECGFDYFRTDDKEKTKKEQVPEFEKQIAFAEAHDLPLMLHIRPTKGSVDAYDDALDILESSFRTLGEKIRGNAHFFAGSLEQAKRFFDIGFTISFTGVITFASDYDAIVQESPLSMLHAETDAPFVTPAPYRGKQNEPPYVIEVIRKISELRDEPMDLVQTVLRDNCKRVFGF